MSQLNQKLQCLEVLENRGMISNIDKEKKQEAQLGLLEAIVQIVSLDGQADKKRCSELIQLISRQYSSKKGKQHVKMVPVKLLKFQNSARRSHDDTYFCAALIRNIKEIVLLLGPKNALVISQDDKARIPLSLATANKQ
ncbi:21422_t:CDS:2, partial [Dentiscutata erythropus]